MQLPELLVSYKTLARTSTRQPERARRGERAREALSEGRADAITFGRPFIANPDLPERIRIGADMNEPDQDTFYGGGAEGYIDYPFLDPRH